MTQANPTQRELDQGRMRSVANNVILHLHPTRVAAPALRFSYTWGLGGISALLSAILIVTGVLLMFRYEPTVERAYNSLQSLETTVAFGSLLRALHHWSANLLVVTLFLHLLRVFFTGGFKKGRGLNWAVGLVLFILVLASNFTGYLLPWDQLAYWAVTVGTSLLAYVPVVGAELGRLALGGSEVGQRTLDNFFALHVAVLPLSLLGLLLYHFWRIRKDGGISQPPPEEGKRTRFVTTIPHLVQREAAAAATVLAVVIVWSMLFPAPLGPLANPSQSPNPAKAAWYFLGLQELLLHLHPLAAMTLIVLVLGALLFVPRLDGGSAGIGVYFRSRPGRTTALLGAVTALYLVPLLIVVDEYRLDWSALLPGQPAVVATGLAPLGVTLGGLALIYGLLLLFIRLRYRRRGVPAGHPEALVGLVAFIMTALIIMTIVGVFFRGPNMALTWPG